jgi:hypothetical protein
MLIDHLCVEVLADFVAELGRCADFVAANEKIGIQLRRDQAVEKTYEHA